MPISNSNSLVTVDSGLRRRITGSKNQLKLHFRFLPWQRSDSSNWTQILIPSFFLTHRFVKVLFKPSSEDFPRALHNHIDNATAPLDGTFYVYVARTQWINQPKTNSVQLHEHENEKVQLIIDPIAKWKLAPNSHTLASMLAQGRPDNWKDKVRANDVNLFINYLICLEQKCYVSLS